MKYTPIYVKPYPNGWADLPKKDTPVKAKDMDNYDNALMHIEKQLAATTEKYDTNSEGSCILSGKAFFMYGGTDNNQKILFQVDENGNASFLGSVTDSEGNSIAGLKEFILQVQEVVESKSSAEVFLTKEALDTWLADETNQAGLKAGQIFLIKEEGIPDYWWNGTELSQVEGKQKYHPDGITILAEEDGTLHAVAGGNVDIWKPNVSADGILTWQRSTNFEAPAAVNIKGEPGGAYTEADKAELEQYIDAKFKVLIGDLLGGAS